MSAKIRISYDKAVKYGDVDFETYDNYKTLLTKAISDNTGVLDLSDTDLTSIRNYCFYCSGYTTVKLPVNTTSIGANAFFNSRIVNIHGGVSNFSVSDDAFTYCTNLNTIYYGNGHLGDIGNNAFGGCGLSNARISTDCTTIGDYAFNACPNLTEIYYDGTQTQWNNIQIGTGAIPQGVVIHCTDGDITIP